MKEIYIMNIYFKPQSQRDSKIDTLVFEMYNWKNIIGSVCKFLEILY